MKNIKNPKIISIVTLILLFIIGFINMNILAGIFLLLLCIVTVRLCLLVLELFFSIFIKKD
jgi:hypothetical protein